MKNENETTLKSNILSVSNAGIVSLNSYIPLLFERLLLVKDNKFISEKAQLEAVCYLEYMVNGKSPIQSPKSPLSKILCGLSPETPVDITFEISEQTKQLCNGLLNAMINHWPAIGSTSADGFRGNWLIREGLLQENEDVFTLTVEKRPYDVLLDRSPFSFSIIKFPWISKPIHTNWPY